VNKGCLVAAIDSAILRVLNNVNGLFIGVYRVFNIFEYDRISSLNSVNLYKNCKIRIVFSSVFILFAIAVRQPF